jgi:hypothetical protein
VSDRTDGMLRRRGKESVQHVQVTWKKKRLEVREGGGTEKPGVELELI